MVDIASVSVRISSWSSSSVVQIGVSKADQVDEESEDDDE